MGSRRRPARILDEPVNETGSGGSRPPPQETSSSRAAFVLSVAKPPELTIEGFTIHSLVGQKTYRWSWIYYYWPWPRRLELLVDAPEHGRLGAAPAIHRDHVPSLLRHPSFPRWLFNPRRAMQYGLTRGEAESYGPPPDTVWTRGSVGWAVAENEKEKAHDNLKLGFDFSLGVDKVGTFDRCAAFAYLDDIRVVPWGHLGVDPKIGEGDAIRFQVGRKLTEGTDQFFVTKGQARAILSVPEAREVPVVPELARALGTG